ncbi:Fur family transcriptional regulator, ferric uptake regulator [Thermosyntropha lipolytica DSM 11003]|uniref:Fur family transcriptional regulator, ferric uptake regulator n=1 Tax=Thermosyntropha lipolytica DSM 11003 TaxID=1123382 RepID=A0A1M5NEP4_9FIRM|nr:Fur family transcriptional regulator, ferric uptake regulator [Thermosyntropha lipolytica DSM 11003]
MDKKITEKLKENNYKLTEQREAVLEVMLDNRGKHLSAEEVLQEAKQKMPNIGIATVYRTLEKLASMDILYKTMFEGGKFRYELSDEDTHQHHHIVCLKCGHIYEFEEDLLNELESRLEARGFEIVDHELKFYGYCPECREKMRK